jgi:hypothetical protein
LEWLLIWHASVEREVLILFERVGIKVADGHVLLLFELVRNRLFEMDEASCMMGVIADQSRFAGQKDLAGHPNFAAAMAGCVSRRLLVQQMNSTIQRQSLSGELAWDARRATVISGNKATAETNSRHKAKDDYSEPLPGNSAGMPRSSLNMGECAL